MGPYEVELLVHIDSCHDSLSFKRTALLQDTLLDFVRRGLIATKLNEHDKLVNNWGTTKRGRAVCTKFYSVDDSDFRFCGECGQLLPHTD